MARSMVVGDIMSTRVVTASTEETVYRVASLMASAGVGSCVIVRDDKPVGIVTERDIVRRFVARGPTSRKVKVGDIMTSPVIVVGEKTGLAEAAAIMAQHRIRRLVVVRDEELVGVVSVTDLVRSIGEGEVGMVAKAILRG
ncbi:MAG: CBS domain-containing protein [Candidatus Caldarchaeum sp.]|nr:CBS domain-containing protein [Candidatus Caldarchaeum sp.]